MATASPTSRLRAVVALLVVLAGIAAVVLIRNRSGERTPPPPAAIRPIETTAPPATPAAPVPEMQVVPARSEIMPMDPATLEAFQEANSRATLQLASNNQGRSYAMTASLSARQAIAELGHDPDRTVQYWLSPQFAADLAAGDPARAVSDRRTIDNLLSVILGDPAGDADFEQILSGLSPDVRSLAFQRRARH